MIKYSVHIDICRKKNLIFIIYCNFQHMAVCLIYFDLTHQHYVHIK